MNAKNKIGNIINYILSAVLVISGTLKLIGFEPYMEVIKGLNPNYYDNIYLIGFVALASGILFAIPKTFTYGFIASLTFLGGTISVHMQAGDIFIPQIVFVVLTGLTAYLKKPEWFNI
jgi:hypothetical protein